VHLVSFSFLGLLTTYDLDGTDFGYEKKMPAIYWLLLSLRSTSAFQSPSDHSGQVKPA